MKYVYRLVNALLSLAVFPVIYFLDLLYIEASVTGASSALYERISIKDYFDLKAGRSDYSTIFSLLNIDFNGVFRWPEQFAPINKRLVVVLVCLALMLIAAVIILVFSIFSNKRMPVLISSGVGLVAISVATAVFSSIGTEFTSGNINIISAFSDSSILSALGGSLLQIGAVRFGGFQAAEIIIFVGLILWTAIFYLSELGETKK